MCKAHETEAGDPEIDQETAGHTEKPRAAAQRFHQGPSGARTHFESPPGLYDYNDLILAGVRRLLDGLIGDGARLVLIVDHGPYSEVVGDHPDPWTLLDGLVCSEDEEPELGPGSRNKLLN